MELSAKLKFYREQNGYSQQDVADYLNISRQSISKWENDKSYPDIENLKRLSEFYKVSIDELLQENEDLKNKIEVSKTKKKLRNVEKLIDKNEDEGVVLLIVGILSCIIFPFGYFLAGIAAYRNKRANTFYKLIYIICICSLLSNIYNTFVYYSLWFFPGETTVELIE